MSKSIAVLFGLACLALPAGVHADSWTDGQAEWARHGSKHGKWDCNGKCPEGRTSSHEDRAPRPKPARGEGDFGGGFDGAWTVSSVGACASAGTSRVVISGHRILGQGVSGTVSSAGTVHTVGIFNGLTILGSGHIAGDAASGSYQQSDGCSGRWSAYKM